MPGVVEWKVSGNEGEGELDNVAGITSMPMSYS